MTEEAIYSGSRGFSPQTHNGRLLILMTIPPRDYRARSGNYGDDLFYFREIYWTGYKDFNIVRIRPNSSSGSAFMMP